jgi:surface carbohydrate biosynthesis protein
VASSARGPRIALLVATPLRDLAGLVLTAQALCRRGATCYLVPQVNGFAEIWALAPDFVLVPAFRSYYASRVRKYVEVGIQFGLLDTEQSVYRNPEEYRTGMWDADDLFREARCACMWGPAIARHVVEKGTFTSEQIAITGCPRFDYYAPPLSRVYGEKVGPSLPGAPPYILINTNFTIGNYSDNTLERMVTNMSRNYGHSREQILEWVRVQREAIASFVDLARRLATDFPQLTIVIRPHPQEREDPYREGTAGFSNIQVRKEGSVTPWVQRSLAVVQRSCSTAIEAVMAGVPALSPSWIPTTHEYPLPEAMSVSLPRYEEFREAVRAIVAGRFQAGRETEARIQELTHEWLHVSDGRAHERVADAVFKSLGPIGTVDAKACRRLLYGLHNDSAWTMRGFANRVRHTLRFPYRWSFRGWKTVEVPRDPHFGAEQVEKLLRSIESVQNGHGTPALTIRDANDAGAYLTDRFRGRSIVLENP